MKVVAYSGTRNLYENMAVCVRSVLAKGKIDVVYLLIEDDEFPFDLGDKVRIKNVSGQRYFPPEGANSSCRWTYMALLKCALSKLFPRLDKMLVLDCDTIVEDDLSHLWELDMTDYYYAAVPQIITTVPNEFIPQKDVTYINAGSLFCNLAKLRKDKKDDELIKALNSRPYDWPEQDCISDLCRGTILPLPSRYNACDFTPADVTVIVRHFAANGSWRSTVFARGYEVGD